MSKDTITLVLSDLHLGGGNADPGDDHVFQQNQLASFIARMTASEEGQAGRYELFFNGDFLEFAQTATDAFAHDSDAAWCTCEESLKKLHVIIDGHPDIFAALNTFQEAGNRVTIAAGNHDVDLYWEKVQHRIQQVAGAGVRFEIGKEWVERHDGLLQIGHGHMFDPANRFQSWALPLATTAGQARLEMCPGTLFMVKFVNALEEQFPFADNLVPVTSLASVLLRDDRSGFRSVAWAFARFVGTTRPSVLGSKAPPDIYGERLLERFGRSAGRRNVLNQALNRHQLDATHSFATADDVTEARLAEAMFALLGKLDKKQWDDLFEFDGNVTLGAGGTTLSAIMQSNFVDGREVLREAARRRARDTGAQVIVMGHTHQPDVQIWERVTYYNPGSWTRYLDLATVPNVTLDMLKDELGYPYELNVVRVERIDEVLHSSLICVDRFPGKLL